MSITEGRIVTKEGSPYTYSTDGSKGSVSVGDGLQSLIGNMGNPDRDKGASVVFTNVRISDEQLIAAYSSNWIARKLVDIPVQDALRKYRVWGSNHGVAIGAEEFRLDVQRKVMEAKKKARLFGGAAVYIGTGQDASTPLIPETIKKGGVKRLAVFTRRELIAGEIDRDIDSDYYGKPMNYLIGTDKAQTTIHPSRLIVLTGNSQADTWLCGGINSGWGDSVLQVTHDAIKQAGSTFSNVASLVFEAMVDVFGIPDLMSNIGSCEYENNLQKRLMIASAGKGLHGALVMDANETYTRNSAQFNNLADLMQQFGLHCAAADDIPATRFLGQSPAGMNSTGEGDMNNYHDRLQSMQELDIGPAMSLFDECLIRSAVGSRPADADYEWQPLKQMSEKEQSAIAKETAEAIKILVDTGLFAQEELRELAIHRFAETKAFPHMEAIIEETNAQLDLDDLDDPEDPAPEPDDE